MGLGDLLPRDVLRTSELGVVQDVERIGNLLNLGRVEDQCAFEPGDDEARLIAGLEPGRRTRAIAQYSDGGADNAADGNRHAGSQACQDGAVLGDDHFDTDAELRHDHFARNATVKDFSYLTGAFQRDVDDTQPDSPADRHRPEFQRLHPELDALDAADVKGKRANRAAPGAEVLVARVLVKRLQIGDHDFEMLDLCFQRPLLTGLQTAADDQVVVTRIGDFAGRCQRVVQRLFDRDIKILFVARSLETQPDLGHLNRKPLGKAEHVRAGSGLVDGRSEVRPDRFVDRRLGIIHCLRSEYEKASQVGAGAEPAGLERQPFQQRRGRHLRCERRRCEG